MAWRRRRQRGGSLKYGVSKISRRIWRRKERKHRKRRHAAGETNESSEAKSWRVSASMRQNAKIESGENESEMPSYRWRSINAWQNRGGSRKHLRRSALGGGCDRRHRQTIINRKRSSKNSSAAAIRKRGGKAISAAGGVCWLAGGNTYYNINIHAVISAIQWRQYQRQCRRAAS